MSLHPPEQSSACLSLLVPSKYDSTFSSWGLQLPAYQYPPLSFVFFSPARCFSLLSSLLNSCLLKGWKRMHPGVNARLFPMRFVHFLWRFVAVGCDPAALLQHGNNYWLEIVSSSLDWLRKNRLDVFKLQLHHGLESVLKYLYFYICVSFHTVSVCVPHYLLWCILARDLLSRTEHFIIIILLSKYEHAWY